MCYIPVYWLVLVRNLSFSPDGTVHFAQVSIQLGTNQLIHHNQNKTKQQQQQQEKRRQSRTAKNIELITWRAVPQV
jgi:hypothetical protein